MNRAIICAVLLLSGSALLATEGEAKAFTQEGTGFKEISIHLRGNKAMTAALSDAVDNGATVTGIADFDSLSAMYGLLGIFRKGVPSGFYGYRFRLIFSPDSNGADIVGAYRNLPYVTVEKWGTVLSKREAGIGRKINYGYFGGIVGGFLGVPIMIAFPFPIDEGPGSHTGAWVYEAAFYGLWYGNIFGSAVAVSKVDRYGNLFLTLAGSALVGAGVPFAVNVLSWKYGLLVSFPAGMLGPAIGATLASEFWERFSGSADRKNTRFSLRLAPNLQRGLSVFATFHL